MDKHELVSYRLQMRTCLRVAIVGLTFLVLVAGCGSSGRYDVDETSKALRSAGWMVKASKGGTVADVKQTGFLKLRAPGGTAINLQFIDGDEAAKAEYDAAVTKLVGFGGTTVRNAIIYLAPLGKEPVPPDDLAELTSLLR